VNHIKSWFPWLILGVVSSLNQLRAVENGTNGSFNTTAPTSSDVPNWNLGWTQPTGQTGVTGWDYVGSVNGASAVYLGNNWVLTAGHVGAGTFTLVGTDYSVVSGSAQGIMDANGTADLTLFKLTLAPNLPSLNVSTSAPTPFSAQQTGSFVAMIGYGGGRGETWGFNTVTQIDLLIQPRGFGFVSTDFETVYGTTTSGANSVTNNYTLVGGDSGGGAFIYNSSFGGWELAGINEAVDSSGDSVMVQLSSYTSQIDSIIGTPEPSSAMFLTAGILVILAHSRSSRCKY